MEDLVNLLVDLRDDRYAPDELSRALGEIASAGFAVEPMQSAPDHLCAWIDDRFGGTWSSEAFAGRNIVAVLHGTPAGFATYDPRGLRFAWLRGIAAEEGVGIFGPFGVDPKFRGSALGRNLLVAALASLRELGYARAIIPAVGADRLAAYYVKHTGARVVERCDKRAWPKRRFRTVALVSGNGTNLQSVLDGVAAERLPLEIAGVVSNNVAARALERAHTAGVPAVLALPWDRKSQSRAQYDALLQETVAKLEPELVLLLGWMHLLSDAFVSRFPHIINIHPAFLPLDQRRDEVAMPDGTVQRVYRGARAVQDCLRDGVRWSGASAHTVTLDCDRGPVLVRRPLAVEDARTPEELLERLHPLEQRVLAGGIMRWVYER